MIDFVNVAPLILVNPLLRFLISSADFYFEASSTLNGTALKAWDVRIT